jgi:predicted alpha/beta hydrolase
MKDILRIHAADGYPLSVTAFIPRKPNGNVVLINSATGVRQKFYGDFASHLCDQGFRVFTYDYRGIGNSKPSTLKDFHAAMHEWGTLDYHSVLKYLFLSYTDCQFTVIGHSIGGQIIGMSPLSENVDRILTVGAQVPHFRDFGTGFIRVKLIAFWYFLIPVLTRLFGYFPASKLGLFEDLPSGVALQWARWAKNKNYLFDELPFMRERFSSLHQAAIAMSFTDDTFAPKKAVENLQLIFSNVKWEQWRITPGHLGQRNLGHFGFFRKKNGSQLWDNVMQWIGKSIQFKESKAA